MERNTTARLRPLCDAFCELVGVPPPSLETDAAGLVAFHLTLREVTVDFLHLPEKHPDHLFVIVDCGPLARHDTGAMQALLEANFLPLQPYPPVFACNASTGDVTLQFVCPLATCTPHDLFEIVGHGIDVALARERGH